MDGVLCTFEESFKEQIGDGIGPVEFKEIHGSKKYWDAIIDHGMSFWEHLPPTKDMIVLKEYVFRNFDKIGILSSSSRKEHGSNVVTHGKMKWLRRHGFLNLIPNKNIIIVDSATHKRKYAWDDKILVDDYAKNISGWIGSGGIGILHKSAKRSIEKLDDYV